MEIRKENHEENSKKTVLALSNYYLEKTGIKVTDKEEETYSNGQLTIPVSFVAEEDNKIIGRIYGHIDTVNGSIRIEGLFVDSIGRSSGIGRKLVNEFEKIGMENECQICFVDTTSSSAPLFYEKLGFIKIGKIDDFPFAGEQYYLYMKRLV